MGLKRLLKEHWLHLAKGTARGQRSRHRHLREGRHNLIVGNEDDRWWAYCQSCKEGDIERKEHVLLTPKAPPKDSESLVLPHDMVLVTSADSAVRDGVGGLLASKNMDALYLPKALYFSDSRKRLLLHTAQGWLGRDTTGRSMQKWLTYNPRTAYLGEHPVVEKSVAVVVEDPFSYYKVLWALRGRVDDVAVWCSLGTAVRGPLAVELLGYSEVVFMYDGDNAGHIGADKESARFRAFNLSSHAACAPLGMDPKDMTIQQIQEHLSTH